MDKTAIELLSLVEMLHMETLRMFGMVLFCMFLVWGFIWAVGFTVMFIRVKLGWDEWDSTAPFFQPHTVPFWRRAGKYMTNSVLAISGVLLIGCVCHGIWPNAQFLEIGGGLASLMVVGSMYAFPIAMWC